MPSRAVFEYATCQNITALIEVRSDLIDLVGFMSGMDREHVEAFLNDAE